MQSALQCLKKHGERFDHEIAKEIGVSLATVRQQLTGLSEQREVVVCKTTRYNNGQPSEVWQCRISGYVPKPAPGRKVASAKPAPVVNDE